MDAWAAVRAHPLALISLALSGIGLLALEGAAPFNPRWTLLLGVAALVTAFADARVPRGSRALEFATAVAISIATTLVAAAGLVALATHGCRVCD